MATMLTRQYLPEKDYQLPDIDLLTMIFGQYFDIVQKICSQVQIRH